MLICYTAHEEQATKWAPYLRERYFDMLINCTCMSAVCEVGAPDAQLHAYKKIIDLADVVLAVYDRDTLPTGSAEDSALAYLTRELSDGTPFVDDTTLQLRRLGVLTIVLPIVSIVLQMIPYAVFDLSAPDRLDNAGSVILGVVLILASLVFRYGAELTQSKEMN